MNAEGDDDLRAENLQDLAEVAELLSLGPSDVVDEQPPASLWAGIEAELAAEAASGGRTLDAAEPATYDGPVVSLDAARSKRNMRTAIIVGVAAAVLLIGVPLGLAVRESSDDPAPEPVAAADLNALSDELSVSGEAELAERELRVETMGLEPVEDAVYELWLLELLDGEVNELVSLGVIDADGTYELDENIDLDRFTVVDISIEPNDGDPSHSGDSVLRGELSDI